MDPGQQAHTPDETAIERPDQELLARVDDLNLHFDTKRGAVQALDGVSFDIFEQETVALVGETGCGKSVTARSFLQLVPTPPGRYPSGNVWFKSEDTCDDCGGEGCSSCFDTGRSFDDLLGLTQKQMQGIRGDRIAMVFQDPQQALNPSLTVKNQVAESILVNHHEEILKEAGVDPTEVDGLTRWLFNNYASPSRSWSRSLLAEIPGLRKHKHRIDEIVHERVVDILEATQIANPQEVVNSYPHELSGGMQQRVMIAMALVAEPDLLIADEPTTALDVTIQAKIIDLMSELQEEFNTSFLYITHDLSLVEDVADRVIVMYAGQTAEVSDVDKMYDNPLHPYTWGLFDSIPTEESVGGRLKGIDGSIPDLTNPPKGCRFCTRCPEALDYCSDERPELVEEEPGHKVSCHLYTDDEVDVAQRGRKQPVMEGEHD